MTVVRARDILAKAQDLLGAATLTIMLPDFNRYPKAPRSLGTLLDMIDDMLNDIEIELKGSNGQEDEKGDQEDSESRDNPQRSRKRECKTR